MSKNGDICVRSKADKGRGFGVPVPLTCRGTVRVPPPPGQVRK